MSAPTLSYRKGKGDVVVDLDRLVASRMLVQANSGGGKSRALRQLLEETHGRVQHLVLDPEGEFATLRERFDYVLAGKEGDVQATPRTAKLLCRRLVELGASAVIDLYDLPLQERREFVKLFLLELMALPRTLWHPILIVIDEAHLFVPERGSGESQSTEAVIALCTQGRKRGYAAVLATQRISKLHKDAAAELLNKLIGRTGLDVDMKRAGDELGLDKEGRRALAQLKPGEFYAYGPAISNEIRVVRTGDVTTTHPEAGKLGAAPPPAPAKVRAVLAQLADLPKEAEEEARTLEDLRRQLRERETRIRQLEKGAPADPVAVQERIKSAVDREVPRALAATTRQHAATMANLRKALEAAMKFIINVSTHNFEIAGVDKAELEKAITAAVGRATQIIDQRLDARAKQVEQLRQSAQKIATQLKAALGDEEVVIAVDVTKNEPFTMSAPTRAAATRPPRTPRPPGTPIDGVSKGQQKIINALAELDALGFPQTNRTQLGMFASYNLTGGSGAQHIADLVGLGLVELPDKGMVRLTEAGHRAAMSEGAPSSLQELHERVFAKISDGQRRILQHLIDIHPDAISRADLGKAVNYNLTGGSGAQHVADLINAGAVVIPAQGKVAASDFLFPAGLQ